MLFRISKQTFPKIGGQLIFSPLIDGEKNSPVIQRGLSKEKNVFDLAIDSTLIHHLSSDFA